MPRKAPSSFLSPLKACCIIDALVFTNTSTLMPWTASAANVSIPSIGVFPCANTVIASCNGCINSACNVPFVDEYFTQFREPFQHESVVGLR